MPRALPLPLFSTDSVSVPTAPERIFAGTSGWSYPAWKPGFYPAGVSAKRFLDYYGTRLNSVEVNFTFRKLPTESMLAGWLAAVSPGFRFSFKAPQRITHFNRLRDCEGLVASFVSSVEAAQHADKLGLLLFQLPPNFKASPHRLEEFMSLSPLNGPFAPRVAFEFRDSSWFTEEIYSILRDHNAALCVAETDDLQTPAVQCAKTHSSFRMRRGGGYNPQEIESFANRVMLLAAERDVYIYFKHEDDPIGALNAVEFLEQCNQVTKP